MAQPNRRLGYAQEHASEQLFPRRNSTAKTTITKKVDVDIVTGKSVISVYFDPSKSSDCRNSDYDWIGCNLYAPASVLPAKDSNEIMSVRLPSGEVFKLTDATRVTDDDDEGVDDILELRNFSEMSLVHTLRVRYFREDIYTTIGPILISLNPYKRIRDLYSDRVMGEYNAGAGGQQPVWKSKCCKQRLPPHLFSVAKAAYCAMIQKELPTASPQSSPTRQLQPQARNQCVIISGESGAGKTEATKVRFFSLILMRARPSHTHTFLYVDRRALTYTYNHL